jgi:hypothetical protein
LEDFLVFAGMRLKAARCVTNGDLRTHRPVSHGESTSSVSKAAETYGERRIEKTFENEGL